MSDTPSWTVTTPTYPPAAVTPQAPSPPAETRTEPDTAVPAHKRLHRARPKDAVPGWRALGASVPPRVGEIGSKFLYVAEQGSVLRAIGSRLRVTKQETTLLDVGAMRLQGVLIYGNVQVTTPCVRELLEEGVWLSWFSRGGRYRGRLQPPIERGGRLRRAQWTRASDPAFCLAFGKSVVRGKLLAQKAVAAAYAKNYLAETLGDGHRVIREALDRLEDVPDLAVLRGVEGSATRAYFDLFRRWNRSDLPFDGREKRPPEDPINALLSFGYTMLNRELEGLIEGAGLDPTIGFYHAPHDDRPSLACDWIEEFRHAIVDRLVLNLINLGQMTSAHFEAGHDRRGVRMTLDGLRTFFRAYEEAMQVSWEAESQPPRGWRAVLLSQLAHLVDVVQTGDEYRPHLGATVQEEHARPDALATLAGASPETVSSVQD